MDPQKNISFELRNLSILIKRYIGRDKNINYPVKCNGFNESDNRATFMHITVIDYLITQRNADVFQRDLEKVFCMRRSTATNMLIRMEKQGLIRRVSVPEDGRLKKILLTEKAIALTKSIETSSCILDKKLTKGFTKKEIDTMSNFIRKMIENLED